MTNTLLVEDDIAFAQLIQGFLKKHDYQVEVRTSIKEAINQLQTNSFQLILLDFNLPDGNGFDFIEKLKQLQIRVPVIILTSFHDVRTAVKALQMGVKDYITKPVNHEELLAVMKQTLQEQAQETVSENTSKEFVKGISEAAQELQRHIELVAPTNMSVIIEGESGTGKENVARSIHNLSNRKDKPFVAIDCGALSEELAASELFGHVKGAFTGAVNDKKGEFERAGGGTLFLDEIGNLSYAIQVKLLRALQEREIQPVGGNKLVKVDVRLICATNEDLRSNVKNNSFREDLFHRLNEFSIHMPPLRERKSDLELFVNHFIKEANAELNKQVKSLSGEVLQIFKKYDWHGNLRELKNIVKRAALIARGEFITKEDIPAEMLHINSGIEKRTENDLKAMNEMNERDLIIKTLREVKYNKSKAAQLLNIDRKTLYLKIAKYGIEA
ncbi:MAG: sigma-54-dependent Fis family transcriptional regulator [Bacteroidetes bacterium]|nr:sigma-54-dependent Fis family transcriptional regulator [Bacteroidota bacterium]